MELHKPEDFICLAVSLTLVKKLDSVLTQGHTGRTHPNPTAVDELIDSLDDDPELVRFICDTVVYDKSDESPSEDSILVQTVKPE